jgi:branched-chain amino acid transport system substrate-binding protein
MEGISGDIPIGVVLPQQQSFGFQTLNGMELAVEEINQSQLLGSATIKLITEDSGGTVEGAVEAFNKLIHRDKVTVILGPGVSSAGREAFPIAQQNQVVAFSPTTAATGLAEIGDFIFRNVLPLNKSVPSLVNITSEKLGYQKVAVIFDNVDLFSISGYEEIKKTLDELGVEIQTTETFETGDTDFSDQLTRINDSNPDAIFVSTTPADRAEVVIQGSQLGIDDTVPFIVPGFSSTNIETAAAAAEGVISGSIWSSSAETPGNQAFVRNYRAKYGNDPDLFAALGYANIYILAAAISDAQSIDSIAIRNALANIDVPTILGQFSFDQNGDPTHPSVVLVVVNGKFEVLE